MTEQSGVHPKEVREFQSNSVPLGRVRTSHNAIATCPLMTQLFSSPCYHSFAFHIQYSDPQEQTSQVILLLSEHSSYQTGSEVFIDGGYLIW